MLKLDLAKAYDRVHWPYLLSILRQKGFDEQWINIIYHTFCNCWYSITYQGCSGGFFKSSRGLRQGDPLSPALFVLMQDALSHQLKTNLLNRKFLPYSCTNVTINVTHLCFTDDLLLFCSANIPSIKFISSLLQRFEACSVQKINYHKSAIYYGAAIPSERREAIEQVLRIQSMTLPFTYWAFQSRKVSQHCKCLITLKLPSKKSFSNGRVNSCRMGES